MLIININYGKGKVGPTLVGRTQGSHLIPGPNSQTLSYDLS